jgi:hypothetical protein
MSVGKTSDDGMVSVFTKEGVNVFKEEDVLMTCKGKPILINIQDNKRMIPNTLDATTRQLAATTHIQTGTEGTTTGQQRIQSTIY